MHKKRSISKGDLVMTWALQRGSFPTFAHHRVLTSCARSQSSAGFLLYDSKGYLGENISISSNSYSDNGIFSVCPDQTQKQINHRRLWVRFWIRAFLCGFSPGNLASSHSPKTCKLGVRLIGHSQLAVGVKVSVDACLSLYVSPAMNWQLVQDSGPLRDPYQDKW